MGIGESKQGPPTRGTRGLHFLLRSLGLLGLGLMSQGRAIAEKGGPSPADPTPAPTVARRETHSFARRNWNVQDGLPQATVTDIAQDSRGVVWVTTFGGLARLDGSSIRTVDMGLDPGLPSNRLMALAFSPDGTMWLGTEDQGLARRREGRFDAVALPPALRGRAVWDLAVAPEGTVWAATDRGLLWVDPSGQMGSALPDPLAGVGTIHAVAISEDGQVLAGTSRGVFQVREGRFESWAPPGASSALSDTWELRFARDGALWGGGPGEVWRAQGDRIQRWPSDSWNLRSTEAEDGTIWWADGTNLLRWDHSEGMVQVAPSPSAFAEARSLLIDLEGSVWVGTTAEGLIQLQPRSIERLVLARQEEYFPVIAVAEDAQGRIWTGGDCSALDYWQQGVSYRLLLGERPTDLKTHPPCVFELLSDPDRGIWALESRGAWLVSGQAGPQINPEAKLWWPVRDPEQVLRLGRQDPKGRLWVVEGASHLRILDPSLGPESPEVDLELPGLRADLPITAIQFGADDSVWIGYEGLVQRWEGGELRQWGPDDGLPRGRVRDILPTGRNEAWVGTYGTGLLRIQENSLLALTTAHGLIENFISRMILDEQGLVWLNGNRGISRVPLSDLDAAGPGRPVQAILYAAGEGIGGSSSSGVRTRDGRLLFPSVEGLVVVNPAEDRFVLPPPPVNIDSLMINGRPYLPTGEPIEVLPGHGDLDVGFTAVSFVDPVRVRVRYQLEGWDPEPVEAGTSRSARYTRLPPGRYRFRVEARNADGVWSSSPVAFEIILQPTFLQRRPVQLGIGLALLGTLGGAIYFAMRRLQGKNAVLQAEVDRRVRVEADLEERRERYRAVFRQADNGFIILDAGGAVLDTNGVAASTLGSSPEALRGRPFVELFTGEVRTKMAAFILQTRESGQAEEQVATHRLDAPLGDAIHLRLRAQRHGGGEPPRILVSMVDLTLQEGQAEARRRLEDQLRQSQKLEAVGRLAGGVAHDFNNVLTVMMGQAALLKEGAEPGETQAAAQQILSAGSRAAAIASRLLAFSRQQTIALQPVPVRPAVEGMVDMLGHLLREEVRLRLIVEAEELWIRADRVQIEQVVMNLVINAGEAMPLGGKVTLRLSREAHPAPWGTVLLQVEDEGIGMTPEVQARIFEPFFTTRAGAGGSGLGLATVHGIVSRLGGLIEVRSAPEQGTTFSIRFPGVSPEESSSVQAVAVRKVEKRASRIEEPPAGAVLVCDDDEMVLHVALRCFERSGWEVSGSTDPLSLIERVRQSPGHYKLIVTDMRMATMSGVELAAACLAIDPNLAVLYMSGYTEIGTHGMDGSHLLPKPFTARELIERARSIIQQKSS